jgi:ParB family chromosome partitioning protein
MSIQKRKIGLGKGLSALLNDTDEVLNKSEKTSSSADNIQQSPNTSDADQGKASTSTQAASPGGICEIEIDRIAINPFQPRTDFDEEALRELSESIKLQGLIQPITVRQDKLGHYQLISGERRLRASKLAGLKAIPAYIRTANDRQMLEMALIENIQRENLNAIEVALSIRPETGRIRRKSQQKSLYRHQLLTPSEVATCNTNRHSRWRSFHGPCPSID